MSAHGLTEMSKKDILSKLIGEYVSVISTVKGLDVVFGCFSVIRRNR